MPARAVIASIGRMAYMTPHLDYVRCSGRNDSTGHPSTVEYVDSLPDAVEAPVYRG